MSRFSFRRHPLPKEGGYSNTERAELSFRAERSGVEKSPRTMLPSPNDSTEQYVTLTSYSSPERAIPQPFEPSEPEPQSGSNGDTITLRLEGAD